MTSLKNKVALITGASRGIGKAIALRYAQLGADIVVNYASNTAAADEVLKEIESYQVRAISVKADVSRPEEIDRMFEYAVKEFGKIDIVVVNSFVSGQYLLVSGGALA
jgi:3-oxoacyl-[acyl-carrier protein] reductase